MPLEAVTEEQFRKVFGDVPELDNPAPFSEGSQRIIVPFDRFQISDLGSMGQFGILETSPYADHHDTDDDPLSHPDASFVIRAGYNSHYGLKARTRQVFRRITRDPWSDEEKEEPELLLLFGDMKYNFGPVSVFYRVMPVSPIHANSDLLLRDPNSYQASIEVMANSL